MMTIQNKAGTRKGYMVALVAALLYSFGSAPCAGATSLSYTDIAEAPAAGGNDINYSLVFSQSSGNTYNATFTISHLLDTTPEWYAGWFTFNFTTGSTPSTIAALSSPAATGPWSILASSTQVLKGGGQYGSPLDSGAAGFYVSSIAQGAPADDPTQGIFLTGPLATTTPKVFTFQFTTQGGTLHEEDMPFKVGYYNKNTGATKWTVNRLSAELDPSVPEPVPEPATMLLMGTGLASLAGLARRRNNKKN